MSASFKKMSQITYSSVDLEILAHTIEQKFEIFAEELSVTIEDKDVLNIIIQKVDSFNYELKLVLNDCKESIAKCDERNSAYKTVAENIIKLQMMSYKLSKKYSGEK